MSSIVLSPLVLFEASLSQRYTIVYDIVIVGYVAIAIAEVVVIEVMVVLNVVCRSTRIQNRNVT